MDTPKKCRCGHEEGGKAPHPCHGFGYTCGQPAQRRMVATGPAVLPGVQPKLSAYETWACDVCWASFQTPLPKAV